jgi:cobalamin biosynthetic protein CobC
LQTLPDPAETAGLEAAAAAAFGTVPARVVAVPGADAGLRWLPFLTRAQRVAIVAPTYGGHRAAWDVAGAAVTDINRHDLPTCDADALVIVNPNNPDGAIIPARYLSAQAAAQRWLIVDESFAETSPDVSVAADHAERLIVLRSFGKFYGLPGLRLGFVIAAPDVAARLREMVGDWPVTSQAIAIGRMAYEDIAWRTTTMSWLSGQATKLDRVLTAAGLTVLGGTSLFRLTASPDAQDRFRRLAEAGILVRPFADQPTWLRFGLPPADGWSRLVAALGDGS